MEIFIGSLISDRNLARLSPDNKTFRASHKLQRLPSAYKLTGEDSARKSKFRDFHKLFRLQSEPKSSCYFSLMRSLSRLISPHELFLPPQNETDTCRTHRHPRWIFDAFSRGDDEVIKLFQSSKLSASSWKISISVRARANRLVMKSSHENEYQTITTGN